MNILITGGTSGIGKEIATRRLEEGHTVFLLVRNLQKAMLFSKYNNAHVLLCPLDDQQKLFKAIDEIFRKGIVFDQIFLFAGDLIKDNAIKEDTTPYFTSVQHSIEYHHQTNVVTVQNVVTVLIKVFGEKLHQALLVLPSSWIVQLPHNHEYLTNEEGYVQSKRALSAYGEKLQKEKYFKEIIIDEIGFVISPMTERNFPLLVADQTVPKMSLGEYVSSLFTTLGQ